MNLSAGGRDARGLDRNRFLAVVLLLSGLANVDTTLEESAVFNADALGYNVTGERTFVADIHAITGGEIAANFPQNDHFAGIDVGRDLSVTSDGHAISWQLD